MSFSIFALSASLDFHFVERIAAAFCVVGVEGEDVDVVASYGRGEILDEAVASRRRF